MARSSSTKMRRIMISNPFFDMDSLKDQIAEVPGGHRSTYVINERCFPDFSDYYGCSVCIAVCPFNHAPYERLKQLFVEKEV